MELQQHLDAFTAEGIAVFAVSPDPPELLARFAARYGITYPLLADAASDVIRRYGILNTLIDPDEPRYGIPFPGAYLTDAQGTVVRREFHREYRVRDAAAFWVAGGDLSEALAGHPHASAGAVRAVLAAPDLKPCQRVPLLVQIALPPELHAYGQPVPEGFIATQVEVRGPEGLRVEPPRFPPTHPLRIEPLDVTLPIFEGPITIEVPLVYAVYDAAPGTAVPLEVTVRFQACSDRECLLPVTERLTLAAVVGALAPRPPAA